MLLLISTQFKISNVSCPVDQRYLRLFQHRPRWIYQYPFIYLATTSNYTPVVGTTTSNLYTQQAPQTYYTTQQQVYTTGPQTTTSYAVNGGSNTYTVGGGATNYVVSGGAQTYAAGAAYGQSGVHKAVAEEIPVESRIEYIPFEKKYIEYEQIEKVYQVPVETEVIEY